jgi:Fic family protein
MKYFDKYKKQMEDRHVKVINKMFDAGPKGFQGKISAKKNMPITQVSKATATRDLQYLHEYGLLIKSGAGRSVRYG